MDFKNKVIIVTGASSGIGEATALSLAKLLAKLVITGRNEAKLKEVADKIEASKGIKPLVIQADLTKDNEVKTIVDETIKCFGQIDILINNAGAGAMANLKDGIEPFDRMINTNLRSVYLLTHLSAPHLIKTKGNIVNVSSIAALKPYPDSMPYCVAKAGLDMFTKCIAKELAVNGVRVNSVNPGPVATTFRARLGHSKEKLAEMNNRDKMLPLGKRATSEEVADVILFLASNRARSITGSIYVTDCGALLP